MNRRHLRAQYRRYLATYTIDALPRPRRQDTQFVACQFEFDGTNLRPVLGVVPLPIKANRLDLRRVSASALRDSGLVELVALLHLSKSGGFNLASATLGI